MPALIERIKVSAMMQESLRLHIIREREKRKQEAAEAEKDFERKVREEEEKRKKIEEENSTMEEIRDQLVKLNEKMQALRDEKHQLFGQFKRALTEESKRKARLREQSEMSGCVGGSYQSPYSGQGLQQGVKRPHSPATPNSNLVHARPSPQLHSSPQQKFDPAPQHHGFLSPATRQPLPSNLQQNPSSIVPTQLPSSQDRMQVAYSTSQQPAAGAASTERPNATPVAAQQHHTRASKDLSPDDQAASARIRLVHQNSKSPQPYGSPYSSSNVRIQSKSPASRFQVKVENDQQTVFTPDGAPLHKFAAMSQGGARFTCPK